LFCRGFLDFIRSEQPDVIISTHFLVTELVSYLKGRGDIKAKFLSIVTDFGVHNFWVAENVDLYIAASYKTQEILISKNVPKENIRVLGIPVRQQFQRRIDKKFARQKLGINPEAFTALILTGGIGMGPIYEIVKLLVKDINIIVICGNNQKLYSQLKQLNNPNLVVLGWIDYVEEVMAASDIAVTKPGGSTISECLLMDLPMIFFSIIPGQEKENAKIISANGLGFILERPRLIKKNIFYLKDNPQEIDSIKKKIENFRIFDSNRKILALIDGK
jgi:processive 1,2-diacylglycerol beta-glucosyltransferase